MCNRSPTNKGHASRLVTQVEELVPMADSHHAMMSHGHGHSSEKESIPDLSTGCRAGRSSPLP